MIESMCAYWPIGSTMRIKMVEPVIIGDCQLYLGDMLDILPTLEDAYESMGLLTDPPYGIGAARDLRANTQHGNAIAPSKEYGASDWDNKPASDTQLSAARMRAKYQIIFGGNYFELPKTSCWLVWDKLTGNNGYADFEMAWTNLQKACRKVVWQWKGMLQHDMKNKEERVHPTQKPIAVMKWCIDQLPDDCIILDPFMGSGTTGVACAKMGRKFIGIEIEERYFQIACKRIEEAYKQPDMFVAPPIPKPVQEALVI